MENKFEVLVEMQNFLSGQIDRYTAILELSRKQAEYIKADDTTSLMKVLAKKQDAIRNVEKKSAEAAGLLKSWEEVRGEIPQEKKADLEEKHEKLKEVLSEVMTLEESGREELSNKMGDTGKTITKMQKGKQMLKAYGGNIPRKSNFMDKTDGGK